MMQEKVENTWRGEKGHRSPRQRLNSAMTKQPCPPSGRPCKGTSLTSRHIGNVSQWEDLSESRGPPAEIRPLQRRREAMRSNAGARSGHLYDFWASLWNTGRKKKANKKQKTFLEDKWCCSSPPKVEWPSQSHVSIRNLWLTEPSKTQLFSPFSRHFGPVTAIKGFYIKSFSAA